MSTTVSTDSRIRRGLLMLGISIFCLNVGLAGHMAMNSNFLHELFSARPFQMGYLEAIRESCGIVSVLLIALLAGMAEPMLGGALLLLVGVGLSCYAGVHSITGVALCSLIWSLGFHLWLPVSTSMTLTLAKSGHAAQRLGQMRSVGSAGFLLGLGCVFLLAPVGMRSVFLLCGVVVAVGAFASWRIVGVARPRLVRPWAFSRRYWLYYLLAFLEGWRKQIFISFATFTLVREYGAPLRHIVVLMLVNNAINWLIAPSVGRLIDRVGEKVVLSLYYPVLAVIFLLYAAVPHRPGLYALYVVDNVMFVFALALPSYLNRIAAPADRRQCLAMGVTMNHIAAVIMPLIGGLLWERYGYRIPFYCGAGVAMISLMVAQALPARVKSIPQGGRTI